MKTNLKKALITHGLAILGFVIITFIVYLPYFTQGEQVSQHDILQSVGASEQINSFTEKTGEDALWNPYMFSGMPSYLTGLNYSGDILKVIYQIYKVGLPHPEGITFMALVSFYILLLAFGVRPWIAFIGAIVFGLNGFNIISITAGHNAKIAATALMPLALAGIHLAFTRKKWLGFGLTAIAMGLQIRTNHPQITYYLLLITLVYGIYQLIHHLKSQQLNKFIFSVLGLIIAVILAVGANAGKLWTTYEYSKYTIRGKSELTADQKESSGLDREYAFRYSNGIMEPLFLFVPNVLGGSSQQALDDDSATAKALRQAGYDRNQVKQQIQAMPTYWGDQPLTAPYYLGAIAFLLFVIGLIVLDKGTKTWLLVVIILGIIMSWGSSFSSVNDLLFDYLPMYNKFRSVTFTIIMSMIGILLIGFIGLEKVWENRNEKEYQKKLFLAIGIAGGFALLLIIGAGMFGYKGAIDSRLPEWLTGALREDRKSLLRADAFRTLAIVVLSGGLVWAYINDKLKERYVLVLLIAIAFIDSFSLSRRFLNEDSFKKNPIRASFKSTEADQFIQKNSTSGQRTLNLQNPFNDAITSYYHESIGGYHGAKIRRYQDLISHCLDGELNDVITNIQAGKRSFNTPVLNMLNTTYFKAGPSRNAILKNPNALGNAWVANQIIKVQSADEELQKTCTISSKEAIVDISKFEITDLTGSGTINLKSRTPNTIVYEASTNGNALGVFSEIYYPEGWTASIDGKEVYILRANYVLRALVIPSGNHEIKFSFEPKSYTLGSTFSLIFSLLIILAFAGSIVVTLKNPDEANG